MQAIEKRFKFTSTQIEINLDAEVNNRVVFQGEGEVVKQEMKSVGKDDECILISHIEPLLASFQASEGHYAKPVIGTGVKKSKSKQLRDLIFIMWSQQWQSKYPNFETYYDATMDKLMEKVRSQIV